MRCAGYNNVDLATADDLGITVLRVPGYSPEAVAEHAMTLAMCVNRRIHKEYIKVRENNFSLVGLKGLNFTENSGYNRNRQDRSGNGKNLSRIWDESNSLR